MRALVEKEPDAWREGMKCRHFHWWGRKGWMGGNWEWKPLTRVLGGGWGVGGRGG